MGFSAATQEHIEADKPNSIDNASKNFRKAMATVRNRTPKAG